MHIVGLNRPISLNYVGLPNEKCYALKRLLFNMLLLYCRTLNAPASVLEVHGH